MAAKQLSLIDHNKNINDKEVIRYVTEELSKYRALKVKMENFMEQQEQGVILFPKIHRDPDLRPIEEIDELRVKQMERALNQGINALERRIIEMKYLAIDEKNDIEIYDELGLKKGKYYEMKKSAIFGIAMALGIL